MRATHAIHLRELGLTIHFQDNQIFKNSQTNRLDQVILQRRISNDNVQDKVKGIIAGRPKTLYTSCK